MSWNNFIAQVAADKAKAQVFGVPRSITNARAHAYQQYNKGTVALDNAVQKVLPTYIAKAKAQKNASYIEYLENQGYKVLAPTE
jgi:hypothetical protein